MGFDVCDCTGVGVGDKEVWIQDLISGMSQLTMRYINVFSHGSVIALVLRFFHSQQFLAATVQDIALM